MGTLTQPKYSIAQYLDLERKAEHKSEYVNGCIFAMAGASRVHNQITFNIAGLLHAQIKDRPCAAYINDMRVKVSATGLYTYPDVAAVCGEPVFEDAIADTLLNPMVIIEVLSQSTEAYDRGEKFAHYRRLSSLADYVLISQDKACVEHFVRQGNQWVLSEINDVEGKINLNSIGCNLSLGEIYNKVHLEDNDESGKKVPGKGLQPAGNQTSA
ncbi:MAG: Uma2 family endonuclease [Desulfosalsimonadaceae bacterium]